MSPSFSDLQELPFRTAAIVGASAAGRSALAALREREVETESSLGGDLGGLPVRPADEWAMPDLDAEAIGGAVGQEMQAQLAQLGFAGPVLDLSGRRVPQWENHFRAGLLEESAGAIAEARARLSDDASRRVFDRLLAYRRSLSPSDLPAPTRRYLHPEVAVASGDTVLDCGAGDGADSLAFAEACAPRGVVHAFEPEPGNFASLRGAIAGSRFAGRVRAWPLAVWNRRETLRLSTGGEREDPPRTVARGEVEIAAAPIDDLTLFGEIPHVDFIKMALEGGEREALAGAARTLRLQRPRLAVGCYHRPDDLWEIPLLVARLMPGCRLFLGHPSQDLTGTLCYARGG